MLINNIRISVVQKYLRQEKLSAVMITKPENIRYLCGFTGTSGRLFVTPKKSTLITDFRYFVTARKLGLGYYDRKAGLKKLMGRYKNIGFEDHHLTVAQLNGLKKTIPGIKWKPVGNLVEKLRMIKDASEIRIIKKAVRITDECLKRFIKTIKVGQSEDQMEWNLLTIIRKLGADGFSFPPIIAFGKNTADVHHQKEPNQLKKGEKILIDFGLKYKGYCTDMTRVFYFSKSIKAEQKLYSTVLKANQVAIQSIKIGKKLSAIDKTARDVIEKTGYGEYFGHALGHGVGLEIHEEPNVSDKSDEVVKPGMVFTIEPGIYIDGVGGVRIEDMVYVNEKGKVEVLTKSSKKMVCM